MTNSRDGARKESVHDTAKKFAMHASNEPPSFSERARRVTNRALKDDDGISMHKFGSAIPHDIISAGTVVSARVGDINLDVIEMNDK